MSHFVSNPIFTIITTSTPYKFKLYTFRFYPLTKGQAADIASEAPIHLARIVIDRGLDFDQMILYPNFIHLSYTLERANRKQILYSKDYYGPKLESL